MPDSKPFCVLKVHFEATVISCKGWSGLGAVRNTLASAASGDLLAFFDIDDIMHQNYLETMLNTHRPGCVTEARYNETLPSGEKGAQGRRTSSLILIDKSVFFDLGGFQPWVCSVDKELRVRRQLHGVPGNVVASAIVDCYRTPWSLTNHPETGKGSLKRLDCEKRIKDMEACGQAIVPVFCTADFEEIFS